MVFGGLMLGSPIIYLKAMRILMFQLSGFYCMTLYQSGSLRNNIGHYSGFYKEPKNSAKHSRNTSPFSRQATSSQRLGIQTFGFSMQAICKNSPWTGNYKLDSVLRPLCYTRFQHSAHRAPFKHALKKVFIRLGMCPGV